MKTTLFRLAKVVVAVIIAIAIVTALAKYWPQVVRVADSLDYRWLGLAFGLCVVYRVLNAAGWGIILGALGQNMPPLQGVRLWLVAETMRWLPGSIWGYCSRVYQAQRAGVPALAASLSVPLELAVTVAAWALVAVLAGRSALEYLGQVLARSSWEAEWLVGGAVLGSGFLVLWWWVRFPENAVARKVKNLIGQLRVAMRCHPRPKCLAAAFAWFVALGIFNGLVFQVLLEAFASPVPPLFTTIGVNAIGWLVGFFAIFSPGGLGVREAVMSALLTPFLPVDAVIGSVVIWRFFQILSEVLCLGVCYALPAVWPGTGDGLTPSLSSHVR